MNEEQEQVQQRWKTRAYKGVALVAGCILIWVALQIMGILWQAVATIIVTAIIAFMLHGVVNFLVSKGLSRAAASGIAIIGFLVLLVGIIAAIVPALVEQLMAFSASLPEYINDAQTTFNSILAAMPADNSYIIDAINQGINWIQEQSGAILQAAASGIVEGVYSVGNGFLIFFIALICAFWILADLPTISREFYSLFNEEQQKTLRVINDAFSTAVYGWASATFICAIIVGVINGIGLWILGVPYFALLGVLCGILYFIPYIGPAVAAVIVCLVALLVSPLVALIALIINVIANNVVANLISPRLMASSVNLHPALVLIAILIGGALGGIVGMLFSIPIAAAIQGVFVTFYEERTGKQLATENGALFQKPKVKYKPTWRHKHKDDAEGESADTLGDGADSTTPEKSDKPEK